LVKLSPLGKAILKAKRFEEYHKGQIPPENDEGYMEFQMYQLIDIFGGFIYKEPFESFDVLIEIGR
jgi:hypothetical protein